MPERTKYKVGICKVKWKAIVDPKKILMPLLHIKLGLMKQFVEALNHKSKAFKYLRSFSPKLSKAKIKNVFFIGLT